MILHPETFNGIPAFGLYRHLDKSIPLRGAGFLVHHHGGRSYISKFCKHRAERLIRCGFWETADENVHNFLSSVVD